MSDQARAEAEAYAWVADHRHYSRVGCYLAGKAAGRAEGIEAAALVLQAPGTPMEYATMVRAALDAAPEQETPHFDPQEPSRYD